MKKYVKASGYVEAGKSFVHIDSESIEIKEVTPVEVMLVDASLFEDIEEILADMDVYSRGVWEDKNMVAILNDQIDISVLSDESKEYLNTCGFWGSPKATLYI